MKPPLKSILIEGNDGTGKDATAKAVERELLNHETIEIDGVDHKLEDLNICFTNFPQYFLPSGHFIRKMNRSGMEEYKTNLLAQGSGIEWDEELRLRMSMFAIDRVLAWAFMDRYSKQSDKPLIHISDRGVFSQSNTIGFMLDSIGKPELFDELFDEIIVPDRGFYEYLNPINAVLQAGNISLGGRETLDNYELEGPLELATRGYEILLERDEFRSFPVKVRNSEGKWLSSPTAIAQKVLAMSDIAIKGRDTSFYTQVQSRVRLGPIEFIETMFPDPSEVFEEHFPIAENWIDSMVKVHKDWSWLQYAKEEEIREKYSRYTNPTRKGMLDEIEFREAYIIETIMREIDLPEGYFDDISPEIVTSLRFLVRDYNNGRVMGLIKYFEENPGGIVPESQRKPSLSRFIKLIIGEENW